MVVVKCYVVSLIDVFAYIGAASVAALISGRITNIEKKNVVCVLSGGNISLEEMYAVCGNK